MFRATLGVVLLGLLTVFPLQAEAQFNFDQIINDIGKKVEETLTDQDSEQDDNEVRQERRERRSTTNDARTGEREVEPASRESVNRPSRTTRPSASSGQPSERPQYDRAWITEVQSRLTSLGYNPGPIDGAFGNKTRVAIFDFQQSQKLPVTGKPTLSLMTALRAASPQPSQTDPEKSVDTRPKVDARRQMQQSAPPPPSTEGTVSSPSDHPTRQRASAPSREVAAAQTAAQQNVAGGTSGKLTCKDIQTWVQSADAENTFEPLPNITLSQLFEDDSFIPFYGRPVATLERDDFNALYGQLFECRKQAAAERDKAAQTVFHKALNKTKKASRSMRKAWKAQKVAEGRVNFLLGGVPRLLRTDPNFFPVLEIAEKSLKGSDVSADVAALERRLQGYGRQAAELQDHRPYLSEAKISGYVSRLRERRQTLQAEATAGDEKLARLLQQIGSVPVSQAGLAELRQLHYQTERSSMTREDQEKYTQAFQTRWQFIQNQIQRQQAQARQALASNPVPVAKALDRVVGGELGPSMMIAGVSTGTTPAEAASAMSSRMGYGEATTFGPGKQFTVTGKALKRYTEQEGRDGGLVNLQTKLGIVGQIEYIEHFTGPIEFASAKQAAIDHFGRPDEESRRGSFTEMAWVQDEHLLKVVFGPRINGVARFSGNWRSSLQVILQSEEFAGYLKDAKERCARLRDKPASELSINDKQDILRGCLTPQPALSN